MAAAEVATPQRSNAPATNHDDDNSPGQDENQLSSSPVSHGSATRRLRFMFTPKREKALPRAWERKPSTPFAPRNEKQQIFRRIPLEELHVNHNAERAFPRGTKIGKEAFRPLKKLKVVKVEEEDKENVDFIGTQWKIEEKMSPVKRKEKTSSNTATREEKTMLGRWADTRLYIAERSEDAQMHEKSDYSDAPQNTSTEDSRLRIPRSPNATSTHASDPKLADNEPGSSCKVLSPSSAASGGSPHDQGVPESRGHVMRDGETSKDGSSRQVAFPTEHDEQEKSDVHVVSTSPELEVGAILDTSTEPLSEAGYPPNEVSFHRHAPDQKSLRKSQHQIEQFVLESPGTTTAVSSGNASTFEHDDTAFLHDFLARTKAQRSVQVQPTTTSKQDLGEESTTIQFEQVYFLPTPEHDGEEIMVEVQQTVLSDEAEEAGLSPRRRSLRSASTRLPLPASGNGGLSSNIALKRLTGKEFIFHGAKALTSASTTRTNTVRNKAAAMPPQQRLIQLRAEYHEDEDVGNSDETGPKKKGRKTEKAKSKAVTWEVDERLVRVHGLEGVVVNEPVDPAFILPTQREEDYQPTDVDESAAAVSKANKKIKRLGTVNGTPAKKGVLESVFDDETEPTAEIEKPQVLKKRVSRLPRKGQ